MKATKSFAQNSRIRASLFHVLSSILALNVCTAIASAASGAEGSKDSSDRSHAVVHRPHMDVAFCIDTTGSMQAEIDMVKNKTKEMVAKLSAAKPSPVIRVGLVAYRDKGDEYVTKVFPFSEDIDLVVKDISALKADGGGDGPEAVDQGLHAAVKELHWDSSKHTAKLLFLIGDAGPHGAATDIDWKKDCRDAINDGIQINTMGCSGLEGYPAQQGTDVFKEIAKLTDGKFESLAYRQEIVDAAGKRTTVVHSGGALYKVTSAPGTTWKGAVARGMMEKVSPGSGIDDLSSRSFAVAASSAPMMSAASASGGSALASPHVMSRARGYASSGGVGGAISSMASNSPSRSDNNLDELMLGAAKAKAQKVLHVDY